MRIIEPSPPLKQRSGGSATLGSAQMSSVFDEGHRASQLDLKHDVAAYRRQRQHRLSVGPSAHHRPVTLHGPPASGERGMIDRDLTRLVSAAQHDALHTRAKPAPILQPRTRLGRRLGA